MKDFKEFFTEYVENMLTEGELGNIVKTLKKAGEHDHAARLQHLTDKVRDGHGNESYGNVKLPQKSHLELKQHHAARASAADARSDREAGDFHHFAARLHATAHTSDNPHVKKAANEISKYIQDSSL